MRTAVGPSLRLYAREYVGRLGRFDRADGYELSRKERITLYEPLFYELRPSRYVWILTLTGMRFWPDVRLRRGRSGGCR